MSENHNCSGVHELLNDPELLNLYYHVQYQLDQLDVDYNDFESIKNNISKIEETIERNSKYFDSYSFIKELQGILDKNHINISAHENYEQKIIDNFSNIIPIFKANCVIHGKVNAENNAKFGSFPYRGGSDGSILTNPLEFFNHYVENCYMNVSTNLDVQIENYIVQARGEIEHIEYKTVDKGWHTEL
jgi:hypothetical protein